MSRKFAKLSRHARTRAGFVVANLATGVPLLLGSLVGS